MKDLGFDTAAGGSGASSTFVGSTAGAKAGASIGASRRPRTLRSHSGFPHSLPATVTIPRCYANLFESLSRQGNRIELHPSPTQTIASSSSRLFFAQHTARFTVATATIWTSSVQPRFPLGENQSSNVTGDYRADADSNVPTTGAGGGVALGSLIRSRSGKLRRVLSNDAAGGMPLPTQSSAGVTSPTSSSSAGHAESLTHAVSSPSKDA